MATTTQPLPTTASNATTLALARQLLRLRGPAYPAPDGSANAADALALGAAIATSRDTNTSSLAEAFPGSATTLLSEWERMLALPPSASLLSTAARRLALTARWRTRFAGTPDAILRALTPLSPPTHARLTVTVIGFDGVYVIDAGSQFSHASGALYDITSTGVTIAGGIGAVDATAVAAGSFSNRAVLDPLVFIGYPVGMGPSAGVLSIVEDATDGPTLRETLARDVHANPRRVFSYSILTTADPATPAIAPLRSVVGVMQPAHTRGHFTNGSLTDGFRVGVGLLGNTVL